MIKLLSNSETIPTVESCAPTLAAESGIGFLGSVGEWESTDLADGGDQTLKVEQTATNTFSIIYTDEKASICGVDAQGVATTAAQGEGEGNTNSITLSVNFMFKCAGATEWLPDSYTIVFEYNTVLDSLTDSTGKNWTRTQ